MCGRFTLKTPLGKWLFSLFGEVCTLDLPDLEPRYNIAPTQSILIAERRSQDNLIQLTFARWGFVPEWSAETRPSAPLINARSETISIKPTFREAFQHGRCAVIADGYYEWQTLDTKSKLPFWILRPDESPFLMAGIAATNRKIVPDHPLRSVAIVTTASNERLSHIHDRMPLILDSVDKVQDWLACRSATSDKDSNAQPSPDESGSLQLTPVPDDFFQARPVSKRVGNPKNEDPRCLDPTPPLWQRNLDIDEPVEPDI